MKLNQLAACVAAVSFLTACGSSSDDDSAPAINMEKAQLVLETNADIALAAYTDSVETAIALRTALATFKTTPTEANLEAAKKAWLVAREPYGQTEVYRFRNSPIDSTDYSSEDGPEGDINAWPLGEALIDYVETNATDFTEDEVGVTANSAGINSDGAVDGSDDTQNIIGTASITIDADLLANTATADDEHDVIAGYHAIEFLLWGQDLNTDTDPASTTNGTDRDDAVNTGTTGGSRPLSDFVSTVDNDAADRRHTYLEVAVDKLIADLEAVRDGWKDGVDGNYRDQFTTIDSEADAKQKLTEILTGMGTLSEGELAGERMQIAYSANSQEDEHSCFSDNTHRDVWLNAEGVSNSFYGTYAGYDSNLDGEDDVTTNAITDGYGINDYLRDVGLDSLAEEAATALASTQTNYTAIDTSARDDSPFDVLIMEDNHSATNPVALTIVSLNKQANLIQEIADELGLGTVVDEDASECDTTNPGSEC